MLRKDSGPPTLCCPASMPTDEVLSLSAVTKNVKWQAAAKEMLDSFSALPILPIAGQILLWRKHKAQPFSVCFTSQQQQKTVSRGSGTQWDSKAHHRKTKGGKT